MLVKLNGFYVYFVNFGYLYFLSLNKFWLINTINRI